MRAVVSPRIACRSAGERAALPSPARGEKVLDRVDFDSISRRRGGTSKLE